MQNGFHLFFLHPFSKTTVNIKVKLITIQGLPPEWEKELNFSQITKEEQKKNPKAVFDAVATLHQTREETIKYMISYKDLGK